MRPYIAAILLCVLLAVVFGTKPPVVQLNVHPGKPLKEINESISTGY